ncbi:hypothetical protein Q9Q99_14040 [Curtobacterium flaccumfaciens]|nr:hypothetical protein Q9Q99_14040 [Curtobacterium flaccumfaciens]
MDATDGRKPPLLITLWWLLYAVFAYVSVLVFLWAALIVAAHALTVFLRFLFSPKQRWIGLAAAAWTIAILGVAVVPFVRATIPQSRQIGWLQAPTWHSAIENGWRLQFFDFALVTTTRSFVTAVAVVSWLLVLVGVAFALRKRREALVVMLPWLIVPTVALLAASHFYKPVYNARYVTYSAPALAILIAAGIVALLPYAKGIISGLLLIAFLIPAGQVWWSIRYASPKSTDLATAARELTEARQDERGPRRAHPREDAPASRPADHRLPVIRRRVEGPLDEDERGGHELLLRTHALRRQRSKRHQGSPHRLVRRRQPNRTRPSQHHPPRRRLQGTPTAHLQRGRRTQLHRRVHPLNMRSTSHDSWHGQATPCPE